MFIWINDNFIESHRFVVITSINRRKFQNNVVDLQQLKCYKTLKNFINGIEIKIFKFIKNSMCGLGFVLEKFGATADQKLVVRRS